MNSSQSNMPFEVPTQPAMALKVLVENPTATKKLMLQWFNGIWDYCAENEEIVPLHSVLAGIQIAGLTQDTTMISKWFAQFLEDRAGEELQKDDFDPTTPIGRLVLVVGLAQKMRGALPFNLMEQMMMNPGSVHIKTDGTEWTEDEMAHIIINGDKISIDDDLDVERTIDGIKDYFRENPVETQSLSILPDEVQSFILEIESRLRDEIISGAQFEIRFRFIRHHDVNFVPPGEELFVMQSYDQVAGSSRNGFTALLVGQCVRKVDHFLNDHVPELIEALDMHIQAHNESFKNGEL